MMITDQRIDIEKDREAFRRVMSRVMSREITKECPRCRGTQSTLKRSGGVLIHILCPACEGKELTETIGDRLGRILSKQA